MRKYFYTPIVTIMFWLILNVSYILWAFHNNVINLLAIAMFSIVSYLFISYCMRNKTITYDAIYCLSYFGSLILNLLLLSPYQEPKTLADIYYLCIGPIILLIIMNYIEKKYAFNISLERYALKIEHIFTVFLFILYLSTKVYIYYNTGIRLFDGNLNDLEMNRYIIPGISGISDIVMYLLLMQLPCLQNKSRIIVIMSVMLLSGLLLAKRGNICRIIIFISITYCVLKNFKL